MNDIWVRTVRPDDAPKVKEWITTNPKNHFDPDIATYPQTKYLCASDGQPLVVLPFQNVLMLESLAIRPDATPQQIAESLAHLIRVIAVNGSANGIHEVYFVSHDPATTAFALKHGFEDMSANSTTLRLKLDKIQ